VDNQGTAQDGTAQNTPAAPDATLARYMALQAEVLRRYPAEPIPAPTGNPTADYRALQAEWTRLNQTKPQPQEAAAPDSYKDKWEQSEWTRADAVYGQESAAAYEAFTTAYEQDQTPFGYRTALEIYHQKRLEQEKPKDQAQTQAATRDQAITPRVDSNRSDVSPDPALQVQEAEARKLGGVEGMAQAIAARFASRR
jgi:hypothetical protein